MPEGDTVWHTATILRDALAGKTLTRCDVRVPKFATMDLTGQVVDEVISRGKHLFIRVGHSSIHSHLKMEGSWKVNPVGKPSRAGHRIRIILEAGDIQAAGIDLGVLEGMERQQAMEAIGRLGPDLVDARQPVQEGAQGGVGARHVGQRWGGRGHTGEATPLDRHRSLGSGGAPGLPDSPA